MTSAGVAKPCKWYAKGQDLPSTELVYSIKPVLSILSTDTSEWVSIACDVTRVKGPTNPLAASSLLGFVGELLGTVTIFATLYYLASTQLFKYLGCVEVVQYDDDAPTEHTSTLLSPQQRLTNTLPRSVKWNSDAKGFKTLT